MSEQPLAPAPTIGRETRDVTVGDRRYRVASLPPRQSLRVIFRIVKTFGEGIGALLSGGLQVEIDGEPVTLTLTDAFMTPVGRGLLLSKLLDGIAKMSGDDLDDMLCDLLVGTMDEPALSYFEGAALIPVTTPEALDRVVLGPMELVSLAKTQLEMSALPTSADDRTGGESSADEMSSKPEDTSSPSGTKRRPRRR